MPNTPDLPVNPELAKAVAKKRAKTRNRTPDILCEEPGCDFIAKSRPEMEEHLIDAHPTGIFGPDKQDAYVRLLLEGKGRHTSARQVGISPATAAAFIAMNPAFDREVQRAEEEYVEKIEAKMYEAALNSEPWAVKEVLSKRNVKRWGPIEQNINVNHRTEGHVEIDASPQMQRIMQLVSDLERRKALGASDSVIDVEVVEDEM